MKNRDSRLDKKINLTKEGDGGIFYSIQGEGKYTGVPSVFIRTSGCNLRCKWKNSDGSFTVCDTPHSSWNPEKNLVTIEEIVEKVKRFKCKHVVVTGGEPYVQKSVADLINVLVEDGHYITVETNGTIYWPSKAQFISLSPKLESSNSACWKARRLIDQVINSFLADGVDYQVKFVMHNFSDLSEIVDFQGDFGIPDDKIWLMPQGITDEQLKERASWVIELCKRAGWNFATRAHIWLYGSKKGV